MTFDLISDTHFDLWTNKKNGKWLKAFIDKIVPYDDDRSDTLVIAGDISHSNRQAYNGIKFLKEYYKNIVVTYGNHDMYLLHAESVEAYEWNSINRINALKESLESIDGVYFLDGDIKEIDGVKYGGTVGFYDGSYTENVLNWTPKSVDELWKRFMDCRHMYTPGEVFFDWRDYCKDEKLKLEYITQNSDVIITHHIPTWEHIRDIYRDSPISGFFHFDGYELTDNCKGKTWVYGHTHDQYNYEFNGCQFVCNPLGYDGEFFQGNWREYDKLPRMIRTIGL